MKKVFSVFLALVLCVCSLPALADNAYDEGLKYMEKGLYYSAYEDFMISSESDGYEMAQKCIQSWPRTGELQHDNSMKNARSELTIKVNQDSDIAFFAKIYKGSKLVSFVFIGGPGQVTVSLPGAKYTIKSGTGRNWFGMKEYFGYDGYYKTLTFDSGSETVYLQQGYAYTLTINSTAEERTGKDVGEKRLNLSDIQD